MPNLTEHCRYTEIRYGVTGEAIHKWMDEPVKVIGPAHRKVRHDPNQKIPQFLVEQYGSVMARDIMLDHILQDAETPDGEELVIDIPQMKLFEKIQELQIENKKLKETHEEIIQFPKINPQKGFWKNLLIEIKNLEIELNSLNQNSPQQTINAVQSKMDQIIGKAVYHCELENDQETKRKFLFAAIRDAENFNDLHRRLTENVK